MSAQSWWSSRLSSIAGADRRSPRVGVGLVAVATIAVVGIALIDYATGVGLSLSVFYLVPIALVTAAVSARAGYALAVVASAAWTLADAFIVTERGAWLQVWNGALRLATISLVVTLVGALRLALQEARRSDQRSRDFLAYAAHQLRTPAAAVQSLSEALVLSNESRRLDSLISKITSETHRMGRLVSGLLRITRLDQGDPLQPRPTDVVGLVGAEADRVRALAPHLDVRVDVAAAPQRPLYVDPSALSEIMANLLDNARRHASRRVEIGIQAHDSELRLWVTDDGPGLPTGLEERAFDRFVSLDGQGGSGLGLAICRSLAEALGGTVTYSARRFLLTITASPLPRSPNHKRDRRRRDVA